MFVKLGPAESDGAGMRQRYAIVWLDEQTYFTQRWRLLHPTDDILGDLFSLHHSLRNNPEWFNFSTRLRPRFVFLVKTNRRVLVPPNVRKAQIIRDKAPGIRALHVSFWTPQTEQEVCENIWKVSLAALTDTGVTPLFSVTRFPNFVRRAIPDGPLSFDFTGELGDAWRYDFTWKFEKDVENNVVRFCSPEGHIEFGTSLWFEDVVGHRSLAQELVFA